VNRRQRATVGALSGAALGALVLGAGLLFEPQRAWFAYLVAWTFGISVCIGALLLLMMGHTAKASWMVVTRRVTEAIVGGFPLYVVLFVPLCFGLAQLYPWVLHPDDHKKHYLNPPFFILRTAFYLATFLGVGTLLRRWSRQNDARPTMKRVQRMRALSGGGLPLVGLATTWASFDWTMSLQPGWSSTIFGLYFFAGAMVGAIALVSVTMNVARVHGRPPTPMTPDHAQALGRLLFGMVAFWAYMAFSQLLVYWMTDIPEEVTFYSTRVEGSWMAVAVLLVFGHFVVPFFALLGRHAKRRPAYLATVAVALLVMHFVDLYWLVLPLHDTAGVRPHWTDLGAVLLVGGLSCAWMVRCYFSAEPVPLHDPLLAEGLDYEAAA
jgi:hypothetical protein